MDTPAPDTFSILTELILQTINAVKRDTGLLQQRLNTKQAIAYTGIVSSFGGFKTHFLDEGLPVHMLGNIKYYEKDEIDDFITTHSFSL